MASFVAASGDAGSVTPANGFSVQFNGVSDALITEGSDVYASGAAGPSAPVGSVCQTLRYSRRWAALAVPLKPAFNR